LGIRRNNLLAEYRPQHISYNNRSFHEHERTFDNWNSWFKDWLFSRYFTKRASKLCLDDRVMAEGVVFCNLKRKAKGRTSMAKLRSDMFDWYYLPKIDNYECDGV
jgi:hypothetical protein